MGKFSLVIHGGAGTLIKGKMTPQMEAEYKTVLEHALDTGYAILKRGGAALDAVEKAVNCLEDSPLFNAGKGSVFTHDETHEMDASVMEGKTRTAGAVAGVTGIKNPISLARDVMQKSKHVFLGGEGAMRFAKALDYSLEKPDYFYDEYRHQQWENLKDSDDFSLDHSYITDGKFGTVGAVACDQNGNLAAATSTGGVTNKRWGRIGDSPVIGAGNYANNRTCAVSCTGSGEFFIRGVVAYEVAALMEFKDMPLCDAADEVIHNRIKEIGGDGGLIAVDAQGHIAFPFNTEGMYRAYAISEEQPGVDGLKAIKIYKA